MGLTTEQDLRRGVAAHKAGNFKEAERIYRTILESQPRHPHACHNLGMLIMTVKEVESALPFFKIALEADPTIQQFWISYVDALIKLKDIDTAKHALARARKQGIKDPSLSSLEAQLPPSNTKDNGSMGGTLSQGVRDTLLHHYNSGQLKDAERLASQITRDFPNDQLAWKILGAVFGVTGRRSKALHANQKAVDISPRDATAHSNLGVTLKGLGRLEEAEKSYIQAIALKPNSYEAHSNLGLLLQERGRLTEAIASYKRAISLKSNFAEAHNYLGTALKELRRFDEAEASYKTAIQLKPNLRFAHSNLGILLQELDRLEEAIRHYDLGGPSAVCKILECLYINQNYPELFHRINSISELDPKNISVAAVSAFVSNQLDRADPYPFCANPLGFILNKSMHEYEQNGEALIDNIIEESDKRNLAWESRTTKNGFQGPSDFFDNPSASTAKLQEIVFKAVEDYYNYFRDESNSLIKLWPKKKRVTGWYNRLLKDGYHTPHIHPGGWLSGVVYLKTVDSVHQDEGAIEFSLHGYDLPIINENLPRKLHRPKRGDIILFPSSLFHRTIPFREETERSVVAFDIKED